MLKYIEILGFTEKQSKEWEITFEIPRNLVNTLLYGVTFVLGQVEIQDLERKCSIKPQ